MVNEGFDMEYARSIGFKVRIVVRQIPQIVTALPITKLVAQGNISQEKYYAMAIKPQKKRHLMRTPLFYCYETATFGQTELLSFATASLVDLWR
jgi:hypothetical protein